MDHQDALPLAHPDLIWNIVSRRNAFLRFGAGDRQVFTAEPHNLLNLNRRKYSQFSNEKNVSIHKNKGEKVATLTITKNLPHQLILSSDIKSLDRKKRASFAITHEALQNHRPDLRREAKQRLTRIHNQRSNIKREKKEPSQ